MLHMKYKLQNLCWISLLLLAACNNAAQKEQSSVDSGIKGYYAYDARFLKKHTKNVVELSNSDGARVLLSAQYQGRVMTSTTKSDSGASFGWINYDLISSGEKRKAFNPVGGEERFWLGPEGGQYSIYFKAGDSFNISHWQVPALIDTMAYDLVRSSSSEAIFSKKTSITNYSGTRFDIGIERKISMLDKKSLEEKLKTTIPAGISFVGYETENRLQNLGAEDWTKQKGLLSIWLLGMFTPTAKTVVIIPFTPLPGARSFITDSYFGSIPQERLQVKDSVLFFACDGKYRSKIGLSPVIARPLAAGFDFEKNVLTLVLPSIEKTASYVNSKWELQKEPYKGDVVNSYNDGPLEDGTQMGPFFEIESSSPALELKKGATGIYRQTTFHLQGGYNSLRQLAKHLLSVDLDAIKN